VHVWYTTIVEEVRRAVLPAEWGDSYRKIQRAALALVRVATRGSNIRRDAKVCFGSKADDWNSKSASGKRRQLFSEILHC